MRRAAPLFLLMLLPSVAAARDPTIETAMKDELARTLKELRIESHAGPYFVAFRLWDRASLQVSATLGALVASDSETARPFSAEVRVGTPEFDNTNFVGGGGWVPEKATTIEADYHAIRHDFWSVTDEAYKAAVETLSRKQAAFENRLRTDPLPDFGPADPVESRDPAVDLDLDPGRWEALARRLSAVFRRFPEFHRSSAGVRLTRQDDYLVTSEGTCLIEPAHILVIGIEAETQAADGMVLADATAVVVSLPDHLPPEAALAAEAEDLARRLSATRTAPVLDDYAGPAVFEDQAAAEVVLAVLARAFASNRPPESGRGESSLPAGPFQNRIGGRVLPRSFSVVDDPTAVAWEGTRLMGSYRYDDEGVPGRKVTLVEGGILKTLLTSRTPQRKLPLSNGHGRGRTGRPAIANLFVDAKDGLSAADLKARLLDEVELRGLPYGIVVRRMAGLTPTSVFRVFPDGREERVRGAQLQDMNHQAFKDILATSSRRYAHQVQQGDAVQGASVVTPSLLFEDVTFKRRQGPFPKLPIAPRRQVP